LCWDCPVTTKPTRTIQGTDNAQDVVGFKRAYGEIMKVGELVQNDWGDLGFILWQVGIADRWMVYWQDGKQQAYNGCYLWSVS